MHFVLRATIIVGGVLLLSLMPALLLRYLGHEVRVDWNENAIETICIVTGHYTQTTQCSYSCNCRSYVCGESTCRRCDTCYYTCYDGYVSVDMWMDAAEDYVSQSTQVTNDDSQAEALAEAKAEYELGSELPCYYQHDNPTDWSFELYNTTGYLVGFWIFVVLGICVLGGWIAYEVYRLRK